MSRKPKKFGTVATANGLSHKPLNETASPIRLSFAGDQNWRSRHATMDWICRRGSFAVVIVAGPVFAAGGGGGGGGGGNGGGTGGGGRVEEAARTSAGKARSGTTRRRNASAPAPALSMTTAFMRQAAILPSRAATARRSPSAACLPTRPSPRNEQSRLFAPQGRPRHCRPWLLSGAPRHNPGLHAGARIYGRSLSAAGVSRPATCSRSTTRSGSSWTSSATQR